VFFRDVLFHHERQLGAAQRANARPWWLPPALSCGSEYEFLTLRRGDVGARVSTVAEHDSSDIRPQLRRLPAVAELWVEAFQSRTQLNADDNEEDP
jgi:hypothetical protein